MHAKVRKDWEVANVVLVDDEPIGLLKVLKDPELWTLSQIQLLPQWQGKGIGGELIQALVADAKIQGCPIELSVLRVNPARRLYERLGFRVVAESTHGYTLRIEA